MSIEDIHSHTIHVLRRTREQRQYFNSISIIFHSMMLLQYEQAHQECCHASPNLLPLPSGSPSLMISCILSSCAAAPNLMVTHELGNILVPNNHLILAPVSAFSNIYVALMFSDFADYLCGFKVYCLSVCDGCFSLLKSFSFYLKFLVLHLFSTSIFYSFSCLILQSSKPSIRWSFNPSSIQFFNILFRSSSISQYFNYSLLHSLAFLVIQFFSPSTLRFFQ